MERTEYQTLYELEDSYWWFVGRRQLVSVLIEAWVPHDQVGPILDIGCGTGGNLAFLANWGRENGLDLSPLALEFAKRRSLPRLVQASGLVLPYKSNTFGLVTAFDVLYHRWVTDDQEVIHECFRVLRPGGWLLVMDSALPSLWSHHDELFYARQRYTLDELRQLVDNAGFQLRKLTYANTLLLPMVLASRWLGRWFSPFSHMEMRPLHSCLNRALTGILSLEAIWLRRRNFPIGSSAVCLAQRPSSTA